MKKKTRKLNVRLLRKIQRHITEEPRRFFMGHFYAVGIPGTSTWQKTSYWLSPFDLSPTVPPCGTAACIAGWANKLSGNKKLESVYAAAKRLGLRKDKTSTEAQGYAYLFLARAWPHPFADRYSDAKTPKQRAKIACQRIDHLIETGK